MVRPIMRSCERLALQVINHTAHIGLIEVCVQFVLFPSMLLSRLLCGMQKCVRGQRSSFILDLGHFHTYHFSLRLIAADPRRPLPVSPSGLLWADQSDMQACSSQSHVNKHLYKEVWGC